MLTLTPDESRVLGVLIEKAMTTPDQYPLSLNAAMNGCNQKNNRDPVLTMTEDACFDALESLRGKGLVVRVDAPGMRVHKHRHNAADVLKLSMRELAVVAELLLRGPQTLGELRGRASRMHALESLEVVKSILDTLAAREDPLTRELEPEPGSRAQRYMQLLCPELHPVDVATSSRAIPAVADENHAKAASAVDPSIAQRVATLESEVESLKKAFRQLAESLGEPNSIP